MVSHGKPGGLIWRTALTSAGLRLELFHAAAGTTITIQDTPKRSATMPNDEA